LAGAHLGSWPGHRIFLFEILPEEEPIYENKFEYEYQDLENKLAKICECLNIDRKTSHFDKAYRGILAYSDKKIIISDISKGSGSYFSFTN
jgi:hypothetical protein